MQATSYDFFASREKQAFQVSAGDKSFEFTLTEVRRRTPVEGQTDNPYTLYFQCPALLPQRIYSFQAPQAEAVDIFIVPVAREAGGFLYEAVFN